MTKKVKWKFILSESECGSGSYIKLSLSLSLRLSLGLSLSLSKKISAESFGPECAVHKDVEIIVL